MTFSQPNDGDPLLMETVEELIFKKNSLDCHRDVISTLVLGSSHGDYAFNPEHFSGSYNLCSTSQDLEHSRALYEYSCKNVKNLKNIIIFYSIFSFSFDLSKSSEKCRCAAYREIFGFGEYERCDEIELAYRSIAGSYKEKIILDHSYGFKKTNSKFYFDEEDSVSDRVKHHCDFSSLAPEKYASQLHHLEHIARCAADRDQKLTIVIAPAREDYRRHVPNKALAFRDLYEFARSGSFKLFDCFDDERYFYEEFGDSDHLLSASGGSERLTKELFALCQQ